MDRASDSGSEGWGFESLPAYHEKGYPIWDNPFHIMLVGRDSNDEMQQSGGLLLAASWMAATLYNLPVANCNESLPAYAP